MSSGWNCWSPLWNRFTTLWIPLHYFGGSVFFWAYSGWNRRKHHANCLISSLWSQHCSTFQQDQTKPDLFLLTAYISCFRWYWLEPAPNLWLLWRTWFTLEPVVWMRLPYPNLKCSCCKNHSSADQPAWDSGDPGCPWNRSVQQQIQLQNQIHWWWEDWRSRQCFWKYERGCWRCWGRCRGWCRSPAPTCPGSPSAEMNTKC